MSMSCLWTGVESSNVVCLLPSMLVTDAQMLTEPLKWSATSKGIMSLTHRLKFAEPLIWEKQRSDLILWRCRIKLLCKGLQEHCDICWSGNKSTDLHIFNHGMAHLVTVVAHSIHCHIHCQLPCHCFPKGVPVQHWHVRPLHLQDSHGQWTKKLFKKHDDCQFVHHVNVPSR